MQRNPDAGDGLFTIKLRRNQVLAGAGFIVVLHLFILHLVDMGHGLH